jgi:hypothetical protein
VEKIGETESVSGAFSFRPASDRRFFVAFVFLLVGISSLCAQQAKPGEYAVKAAYLYNFARFVDWPPGAAAPRESSFSICVLGQDPFGQALNTVLAGEAVDGKPVVARRIYRPQEAAGCRILFISASEEDRLKDILAALANSSVLTVSDIPQFSRRGGMIEFVLDGKKVRFEVNLTATQDAGLNLSSELLKVAMNVRRNSQPGD